MDLQHKVNKMQIPMFDGTRMTARAWFHQLQTYFILNPSMEEDTTHFASLHLEGDALEWWRHGMVSQGYSHISTFDEFARRLAKRFDRKGEDDYFQDLIALRQSGAVDEFMTKF